MTSLLTRMMLSPLGAVGPQTQCFQVNSTPASHVDGVWPPYSFVVVVVVVDHTVLSEARYDLCCG